MSESKKVKLRTIPATAVVNLDFSGAFHKRIVGAYFNYVSKIETASFEKIMQHMDKDEVNKLSGDELVDAVSLQTLLILISNLEKEFTDAKLDEEKEFDMPIED
jgi:hypothetical protein